MGSVLEVSARRMELGHRTCRFSPSHKVLSRWHRGDILANCKLPEQRCPKPNLQHFHL